MGALPITITTFKIPRLASIIALLYFCCICELDFQSKNCKDQPSRQLEDKKKLGFDSINFNSAELICGFFTLEPARPAVFLRLNYQQVLISLKTTETSVKQLSRGADRNKGAARILIR